MIKLGSVSKAFTKEDDDTGFTLKPSAPSAAAEPFRLTATGAKLMGEKAANEPSLRDALAVAEVLAPVLSPERAMLGVTVRVSDGDHEHTYRLVSGAERNLLGEGCSVEGPIGRALLGAEVGDVREVTLPRGPVELEVIALEGETR